MAVKHHRHVTVLMSVFVFSSQVPDVNIHIRFTPIAGEKQKHDLYILIWSSFFYHCFRATLKCRMPDIFCFCHYYFPSYLSHDPPFILQTSQATRHWSSKAFRATTRCSWMTRRKTRSTLTALDPISCIWMCATWACWKRRKPVGSCGCWMWEKPLRSCSPWVLHTRYARCSKRQSTLGRRGRPAWSWNPQPASSSREWL